jgi:surface antigen
LPAVRFSLLKIPHPVPDLRPSTSNQNGGEIMLRKLSIFSAIGILLLAMSCAQWEQLGTREKGAAAGVAGGAVLGQVVGGSTEATLLGGAIGGILGYIVGNQMQQSDRTQLNQALETTPSYETKKWQNPETGSQYAVTPQPTYQAEDRVCRKVDILADMDGRTENTQATACREDGRWVLQ